MTTATEQRIAEIRAQAVARCPTPESGHDALEIDCADLAFLLSELDAAKKDAERLDYLEAEARVHRGYDDAQTQAISFDELTGKFFFRQWGAMPYDDHGNPDVGKRFFRQAPFATLREAIDAAKAAAGSPEGSDE